MFDRLNKYLEKFNESKLKKMSLEQYVQLNYKEKEIYKSQVFTAIMCHQAKYPKKRFGQYIFKRKFISVVEEASIINELNNAPIAKEFGIKV